MKHQMIVFAVTAGVAVGATAIAASHPPAPPPTTVLDVKTGEIPRTALLEANMLVATIAPGDASIWHTHDAPVFAYTESGSYAVDFADGRPSIIVPAGKAIMEPVHTVVRARNPSSVTPAKLVLFQLRAPKTRFLQPASHK